MALHGCTQSPDDFTAGTRLNEAAEAEGFLVPYPEQTSVHNIQKCWNWFVEGDQRRDAREAAGLAGLVRLVMDDYTIDPSRVYVAGLSAGGAMATVMGNAYPDIFASIGVHSELAAGAAQDMPSAFAAMRHGAPRQNPRCHAPSCPTIVLHGDQDTRVNFRNADAVAAEVIRVRI